ncbi:MAG: OmpA family protein [Saprospiraceae bacterium]|nr:OmpA family protein [Saprospiraceae bacterium]
MRRFFLPLLLIGVLIASCTYTQKIRDGKTAFEQKQYSVAVKMLQKEYDKAKTRVERGKLALLIGESYKELNKSEESIRWYQIAYDNQAGVDALKEKAYALKRGEQYKEAMQAFKELGIEIGSPYEYRREINACEIAQGWKDALQYAEYRVDLMEFNTKDADYAPVLYKDNNLVFTSDRSTSTGEEVYNWTGNKFSDLFLVDLSSNNVKPFDLQLNTENNEGTAVFNKAFTEMYFTRCFGGKREDAFCKIMVSEWQNGTWSAPRVLDFVQPNINYGHPSISADGKELYFACNSLDGWGGYDIYVSERSLEGWGEPKILSRSINTIGNEKFPYIDGDTLYFSSDFHPGMGGLDIFRTYKMGNGNWAPPFNLKPPINSGGDDFGFVVDYQAKTSNEILQIGYFTSTRMDGLGNDDIYQFEKIIPPPKPVVQIPEQPKQVEAKMILDVYVLEKIYEDPSNPNSRVLGRKPLPEAKIEMQVGKETKTFSTAGEEPVTIELNENLDYNFLASKENYLNNIAKFTTKGIGKDPNNPVQHFEVEIVLDKILLDKEIRLENIYYDLDKWDIRDDAKPTLDALAESLGLNPQIRIQLSSHTDCRASDTYNETLSQRRAQSAVDYLISKGIDASRLVAKGYGETQPEVSCICTRCSEEEHQQNRRTTFKIIE